jgi:UDP-3-O-[3-hydroxymyristoyl] glucosamine N-acyltransferase
VILRELADRLGCVLRGDGGVEVHRVSGIEDSGPGDLTFVANPRYVPRLATTRASAVILSPELETPLPSLVSPNPYLAYARAAGILHPQARPAPGVDPAPVIRPPAWRRTCTSAPWPWWERARIGARSVVHAHSVLYPDVEIGDDCVLHSGVHVREACRLGHRVIVQNGAVIGGDGFGFARDQDGRYEKIPQVGIVVVEDDVEIGALVAIDRAAMRETRIGRGTKIDNLVQIGTR